MVNKRPGPLKAFPFPALAITLGSLFACASANAVPTIAPANIGTLDTGYGFSATDTVANAPILDPIWTVPLLSTGNAGGTGGTPPGGIPGGAIGAVVPAYLVPN